jgi:hypothetical protein
MASRPIFALRAPLAFAFSFHSQKQIAGPESCRGTGYGVLKLVLLCSCFAEKENDGEFLLNRLTGSPEVRLS